jgi:hypothetical protein
MTFDGLHEVVAQRTLILLQSRRSFIDAQVRKTKDMLTANENIC